MDKGFEIDTKSMDDSGDVRKKSLLCAKKDERFSTGHKDGIQQRPLLEEQFPEMGWDRRWCWSIRSSESALSLAIAASLHLNNATTLNDKSNLCVNTIPQAEIVKDIGSGLNFKRKCLRSILERAMCGACIQLVVAHRDRLAKFGYELIKQIIEHNGGEILVLDSVFCSPEQELTKDLLNIFHVFSFREHGIRNYKKQIHQPITDAQSENAIIELDDWLH